MKALRVSHSNDGEVSLFLLVSQKNVISSEITLQKASSESKRGSRRQDLNCLGFESNKRFRITVEWSETVIGEYCTEISDEIIFLSTIK